MMFLRHALSVAILPGAVTVIVPIWIARRNAIMPARPDGPGGAALVALGVVVLAIDQGTPAVVVKSVFQTAAFAGYPNVSFMVKSLPAQ